MVRRAKYRITTWCPATQEFTPQRGVRCGPYRLMGLRKALRKLRRLGYDAGRADPSVYVERYHPAP